MIRFLLAVLISTSFLTACSASDNATSTEDVAAADTSAPTPDTTVDPGLEIVGEYTDNYDQDLSITNTAWDAGAVVQYDNDANHLVMQNPSDAEWSPSLFNRIVWLNPEADGSFWFCWEALDQETQEDALNATEQADAADPATGGCGGFPWSKATPKS